MSKLARVLVVGATLAAMNLAGLTAVAHARANDDPDGRNARRLATERQAGETWRKRPPVTSQPTTMDAAVRQLLRERSSIPSGTPAQARPDAGCRTERTAGLAPRFARRAGRGPGAHRWAGRAGRQTGRPQSPGRPRSLTTPSDGAAAPTRQPHRLAGGQKFE
jgi:hypothetical protein